MIPSATTRSRRKNRNRNDVIAAQRAEIARLKTERLQLAKLARPNHPKGGFFNPLVVWETEALADRVLEEGVR